jgi:predicted RND superfamily exporter protein
MAGSGIDKLSTFISQKFGVIIIVVMLLSLFFFMSWMGTPANTSEEAMESDTEIHKAWRRYEDSFRPSTHGLPIVVEAKDGNVLEMEEIRDIADALNKVAEDDIVKPMLLTYFDDTLFMNVSSTNGVPYTVDLIMNNPTPYGYQIGYHNTSKPGNGIENATNADLNLILDNIFAITDSEDNAIYREMVSSELTKNGDSYSAPVMMIFIGVDNDILEQNYTFDPSDEDKIFFEEFDLHVLDILKENIETCNVYGVGLGIVDEINKEIMSSVPFIMFTFIVIIIILALTFKGNFKSFLACSIGLLLVIFWMKGSERLLDLAVTQFNTFLPILIMALSVDYAIHSMKRFEEELVKGRTPREAVKFSTMHLTGTLALAMVTTFVAFFSNIFSSIPALADWGLEAGLSIIWTFVIMGIFVPALRLGFERGASRDQPAYVPDKISKNNKEDKKAEKRRAKYEKMAQNKLGTSLSRMTAGSISRPAIVIVLLVLLVVPLGYGALNLGTNFEVEEFFDRNSDFVVGLNMYTEHFPEGGEPNILLIEGDIADPDVLDAIDTTRTRLDSRGYATWYAFDIAQVIEGFTANLAVNNMIGGNSISVTDSDGNGLPDEKSEIVAIMKQLFEIGLWESADGQPYMSLWPGYVRDVLYLNENTDSFDKAILAIGVSGSGSLDNIKVGMDNILKDSQVIDDTGKAETVVTGSGPLRYEQLTAISNSLQTSIVISIILCFIIIVAVFRKLGFSIIAILPVILIAVWLYGIMYWTGFNLNIVTASIGAMSIGVGVDYSIHICDRYRKEKAEGRKFEEAMDATISNTGAALLFAALTTTFGFFVMLFAPMPMFFSFGLFSGLMVALAFIAAVIVVPPLIKLAERNNSGKEK